MLDAIPRGYVRYTSGVVASAKLPALVSKFHRVHAVAATPAQRMTRKKQGKANAILALYQPKDAEMVLWLLLFTPGELGANEVLKHVADKPRLSWLGYELSRHNYKESTRWTWRRPREAMQELYAALDAQLKQHHWRAVEQTLARIARQPGFHGVRGQSWRLCQEAKSRGYPGELPVLFYLQKVGHGERISVV
ncbi:hypothetical protein [Diaphorobacter nitroreducens]|uniref:hypothetical protein n=1 Tax=Diaphorobacter nitroreducens TaxID=164759 RepID=UPI0028A270E9|nr:hypothetical protein [Diaphorobacter nitroreducens]